LVNLTPIFMRFDEQQREQRRAHEDRCEIHQGHKGARSERAILQVSCSHSSTPPFGFKYSLVLRV